MIWSIIRRWTSTLRCRRSTLKQLRITRKAKEHSCAVISLRICCEEVKYRIRNFCLKHFMREKNLLAGVLFLFHKLLLHHHRWQQIKISLWSPFPLFFQRFVTKNGSFNPRSVFLPELFNLKTKIYPFFFGAYVTQLDCSIIEVNNTVRE